MSEQCAVDGGIDCESGIDRHILLPLHVAHEVIKFIGIDGIELHDRFKHPQGRAAAEVGFVEEFEIAFELHHSHTGLDVLCAKRDEFVA